MEDAADAVNDVEDAADDIAKTAEEIKKQHNEATDALLAKKTTNAVVMSAYIIIPIALIAGAFAIKLIYGLFTKTADKVGAGAKTAASKLESVIGQFAKDEEPGADGQNDNKKKPKLLYGEILRRFVATGLSESDVNEALEKQKTGNPRKLLGEILEECGQITKADSTRALKIQKKR